MPIILALKTKTALVNLQGIVSTLIEVMANGDPETAKQEAQNVKARLQEAIDDIPTDDTERAFADATCNLEEHWGTVYQKLQAGETPDADHREAVEADVQIIVGNSRV